MIWTGIVFVSFFIYTESDNRETFETINSETFLQDTFRTDLYFLGNYQLEGKTYRFEDFFWTGSGDGDYDENDNQVPTTATSTIFSTKTVYTTDYVTKILPGDNSTNCYSNCDGSKTDETIKPTPTIDIPETTEEDDNFIYADRQFWLLTVLKTDGRDPLVVTLKKNLAHLYKKAFERQQARHLGITSRKRRDTNKTVKVYIHHLSKRNINDDKEVEVLYHVTVGGRPVPAITAAADMRLVSDDEVREELGYPFLIKAEPYLKEPVQQSYSRSNNTWLAIGGSIITLFLILLLIAFITLGCTRSKKTSAASSKTKTILETEAVKKGQFPKDLKAKRQESPTYINFRNQAVQPFSVKGVSTRSRSASSSTSMSSTSLDISPLMAIKKSTNVKKQSRPRAAFNKTVPIMDKQIPPEVFDSDNSRRESPDVMYADNYDTGMMSPKSFLSMPSVKSFPRISNPEPLTRVLEPVSVLHLDMPSEDYNVEIDDTYREFIRHGSVGTAEDPGVIGPAAWGAHRRMLQHGTSVDEGIDTYKGTENVSSMRKRFNELLDDTFSLFGSRRESPKKRTDKTSDFKSVEIKSHSASTSRLSGESTVVDTTTQRPKTTDLKSHLAAVSKPKGAWRSTAPSPLIRPLSAGPVAPKVNVEHILSEGKFKMNDPAVPLIDAIKSELKRCSLPGSTTSLNQ